MHYIHLHNVQFMLHILLLNFIYMPNQIAQHVKHKHMLHSINNNSKMCFSTIKFQFNYAVG